MLRHRVALAGLLALSACQADSMLVVACRSEAVVYGRDDRRELAEQPEPWQRWSERLDVALMDRRDLAAASEHSARELRLRARDAFGLCADERYAEQPALALCSGVLLAADSVLTAAHCVDEIDACQQLVYVRGYALSDAGTDALAGADARDCARIDRVQPASSELDPGSDVALVHLAAPFPVETAALPIRAAPPQLGEHLFALGHPLGLPLKLDAGARVRWIDPNDPDHATADVDAFVGSSGGPVLDTEGALLGLVTGGQRDLDYDRADRCYRSRVRDLQHLEAARAERIDTLARMLGELCQAGSSRACELLETASADAPVITGDGC